jgi:hypothetical protein
MAGEIGAMLREARMRARIDVSEIEAQTKIRAKYLRALENEEWDLLPGPTFVKSFLRTYAQALGLDARMIVEEYRLHYERPSEHDLVPLAPSSARSRRAAPRRQIPPGWIAGGVVALLIVLLVVIGSIHSGGGSKKPKQSGFRPVPAVHTPAHLATTPTVHHPTMASLQLRPTADVYVCLVTSAGHRVIPGLILMPGQLQPVHHARVFLLTLGNGSLTMRVNGKILSVPQSSKPISYVISSHGRHTLAASAAPTCA